jgi:hypothetical protein
MPETQPNTEPLISEEKNKPTDRTLKPWTLRATHRHPAVSWLIVLLIVLQMVLGGIVIVQARKMLDMGERIERLEKQQPYGSE